MPVQAGAAVNPALLGYGEQNTFFAGSVFSPNVVGFYADAALFSPFGGLLLSADYLIADDTTAALSFGYGSFVSRRIATGLSITPRFTAGNGRQAFGLGFDPALLLDSKWHKSFSGNDGWGIYSPSVFLRTQNLALPFGESNLLASPSAHVGVFTGFYQSMHFNLAVVTSTYGAERFDRLPLLLGVQAQYRFALLSLGYGMAHFRPTGNGFHLGLGVTLPADFGDSYFFYAVGFGTSERSMLHSVTLGVRLGGIDRDAPEIAMESEELYFSPNNDGIKDLMGFRLHVRDKSPVVFYEFRVLDAKNNVVFRKRADERLREKEFSWSLFIRSFVSPRVRSDIPERLVWNGRMASERKKPVKEAVFEDDTPYTALPDGAYTWDFRAIDEKNNESPVISGVIHIDTKAPEAAVSLSDDLLSPNGDGRRDVLTITQDVTPTDRYTGMVIDAQGRAIRTWQWQNNAPVKLDFDGRRDNGDLADEGVYRYRLLGHDAAGNSAQAESGNFYISRRVDEVFLRSSDFLLNPKNPRRRAVQFFPSVAFGDGYIEGEILISRQCAPTKITNKEEIIYRIAVTGVHFDDAKKNARKEKIPSYSWAGEAFTGAMAADGSYCALFRAWYENGNAPQSPPLRLGLDTTGPELDVTADLTARQFAPDGDGEYDEQAFRIFVQDQSPIAAYALAISEVAFLPEGVKLLTVRRFSGQGELPHTIYWDGKSESGAPVESLTLYEYALSVTDVLGNSSTVTRRFESAVLALPTSTGFLVRLPYANLEEPVTDRLSAVYRLLERYPKYRIKVEAHTALTGKIEQNLELSESAARKVRDYLVEQGIAPERISYQGFGDTAPIYPVRHAFAGRNRRIDIYLVR